MEYDNNLTGIISKNDKKTTDAHPDIKGQCEINNIQYWVAGWMQERKDGTGKFYKLKFEPKDKPVQKHDKRFDDAKSRQLDDADSIPF